MSGWIYTLAEGVVSWARKKQTCISHSTVEAEFIALAAAGKEAEWMRDLLLDIQLWPNLIPLIPMYCDSQATLSKAYNYVYNGKSRHIRLRHNYYGVAENLDEDIQSFRGILATETLTEL
ncbi:hypothetical protein Tco_0609992 [Tanacetum coccineum]